MNKVAFCCPKCKKRSLREVIFNAQVQRNVLRIEVIRSQHSATHQKGASLIQQTGQDEIVNYINAPKAYLCKSCKFRIGVSNNAELLEWLVHNNMTTMSEQERWVYEKQHRPVLIETGYISTEFMRQLRES